MSPCDKGKNENPNNNVRMPRVRYTFILLEERFDFKFSSCRSRFSFLFRLSSISAIGSKEVGADVGPAGTDGAALGGCIDGRMHHLVFNKTLKIGMNSNQDRDGRRL